jgi:site-specific DNA-adenine methylase
MYHLVELCCGSAALSLYTVKRRPLLVYCGSKAAYAKSIMERIGVDPSYVSNITLNDVGMWGWIWRALQLNASEIKNIIGQHANEEDQKTFYSRLDALIAASRNAWQKAVYYLVKLAGTWRGMEVGNFKSIKGGFVPKLKTLAERCAIMDNVLRNWTCLQLDASAVDIPSVKPDDTVICYIDPPYKNHEFPYVHHLERDRVIHLAKKWANAIVVISECEPLQRILGAGWKSEDISDSLPNDTRRSKAFRNI